MVEAVTTGVPSWNDLAAGVATTFLNVLSFGAIGNSVADDTAAIQAAMNAAGRLSGGSTVYFPAGTYKITSSLNMTSGVSLVGDGPDSIIRQTTDYTPGISPAAGSADQTIRDLTLQGSYTHVTYPNQSIGILGGPVVFPPTSNADSAWHGNRMTVMNCSFLDWGMNAIGVANTCNILNNRFNHIFNEPIIIGGDDSLIEGNYINGCGSWGIDNNGSHTRIANNLIYNAGVAAVQAEDGGGIISIPAGRNISHIHIEGNTIDTSDTHGIWVIGNSTPTQKVVVVANNIVRNVWNVPFPIGSDLLGGIQIEQRSNFTSLTDVLVEGNIVSQTYGHGIQLSDANDVDVINNHVSDVSGGGTTQEIGNGIRLRCQFSQAADVNIRGNTVVRCSSPGIYITGGASPLEALRVQVVGNRITSPSPGLSPVPTLSVLNALQFNVNDNFIQGLSGDYGIQTGGDSGQGAISGNYIVGTNYGILHTSSGGAISFLNNGLRNTTVPFFVLGGSMVNVLVRNNGGYNPLGSLLNSGLGNPVVPASGVAYANLFGVDCWVAVTAPANPAPDGITAISLTGPKAGDTVGLWPSVAGLVRSAYTTITVLVPALYSITLTYTIAPTWEWFGN